MEESIISALHNNDIEQKRKKQLVTPTMNTKVHSGKKKKRKRKRTRKKEQRPKKKLKQLGKSWEETQKKKHV